MFARAIDNENETHHEHSMKIYVGRIFKKERTALYKASKESPFLLFEFISELKIMWNECTFFRI